MTRFMGKDIVLKIDGVVVGKAQSLSYNTELKEAQKKQPLPPGYGQPWIDHQDLKWESDWSGDEIGHDEIESPIGLYRWRDTNVYLYLNTETMEIIDIWENKDDE